ncbi:MAG: glycosyltransferase [Planctomycetota bacterium]
MTVLFCWSCVVLLFWVLLFLDPRRAWPRRSMLPSGSPPEEAPPESKELAVVIPARNEEDLLGKTLPSLLEQSEDYATLVLVDDRSSDGTGETARKLIKESPAASIAGVVAGLEPPPGWSGKTFALASAVERTLQSPGGDDIRWFLFTDADILHPPGSIRALRQVAGDGERSLVSVMVRLSVAGWWERLLVPAFVWFFHLLYPFRSVARASSRVAAAAGGCILVSREYLEKIGGLEVIAGEVIDDINLAAKVKQAGGSLWLGLSKTMVSVRQYCSLGGISSMVTRTAFDQLGYSYILLGLTLLGLLGFFVSPPLLCLFSLLFDEPLAGFCGVLAMALQALKYWPALRHHDLPPRYALSLPLASLLYTCMTFLSGWNHLMGRGEVWRGRKLGGAED